MTEPVRNLAIFDLDYTLTSRGTWGRFVWQAVKFRPHIWLPLLFAAGWTQYRYKKGKLPRVRVKQAMMRWCMVGKPKTEMLAMADIFAQNEVENGLRPGGIRVLKTHKDAGDNIMIVSAAVDIIVEAIARRLDIQHYLATDMAWDEDERLSPDFASPNCYGSEKVVRLKAYLDQNAYLKHNHTIITMYSDSYSDLDILQFCDIGIAVNPDRRLASMAKTHGFDVVNWEI